MHFIASTASRMHILKVDPGAPDAAALAAAVAVLRRGGLVAFPTETVYGLGANALDEAAVRGIFAAKGRPSYNPLIAHAASTADARALVTRWPRAAQRLADAFWPGPLTLVLPKHPHVPDRVSAGLPTVAIRVPAHPVALALLRAASLPIAAPSANRFTELSPTTAAHVARGLGDRVDLILDGGPTSVGIESTVVDLTGDVPVILRPGFLSRDALVEVVGPVGTLAEHTGDTPRPSPGMTDRHYSPRAELRVYGIEQRDAMERAARAAAGPVGALLLDDRDFPATRIVRMPADPHGYARRLYATLHELDEHGCTLVLVDRVPEGHAWAGIRDRLRRAAYAEGAG